MNHKTILLVAAFLAAAYLGGCCSSAKCGKNVQPEKQTVASSSPAPAVKPADAAALAKADSAIANAKDAKAKSKALFAKIRLLEQQKQTEQAMALREKLFRDASMSANDRCAAFVPWGRAKYNANKRDKAVLAELLDQTESMFNMPELRGTEYGAAQLFCDIYKSSDIKENTRMEKFCRKAAVSPALGFYHRGVYALRLANMLAEQDKFAEGEKILRSVVFDPSCRSEVDSIYTANFLAEYLTSAGKLDEAIAVFKTLENKFPKSEAVKKAAANGIAKQYQHFFRKDDAIKVLKDAGCYVAAAKIMRPELGWKEAEKILKDEKMPLSERLEAYRMLIDARSPEYVAFRDQYRKFYRENSKQIGFSTGRFGPLWTAVMNGDYAKGAQLAELARSYDTEKDKYQTVFFQIRSYYGLHRDKDAAALAKQYASFEKFSAQERLILALLAEMNQPDYAKHIDALLKKFPVSKDLTAKARSQALLQAGKVAMTAEKESAAVALDAAYQKLFAPEPTKEFVIRFAEEPVFGISDFLKMKDQPHPQLMDRKYGGNMDFLTTDVSTGDRTGNMGSGKILNYNKFYAFCDENGLHLIFAIPAADPLAAMSGLAPSGSFEMYLAPGKLQPHNCFLIDIGKSVNHVYSTIYNNPMYHRIRENNPDDIRTEARAGEKCVWQYLFLDWNNYYNCLPENNTEWDFENLHWASFMGGYGWNGAKSIHGHSTWGRLKFKLTKAQEAKIRFHVLTRAKSFYEMEKRFISRNFDEPMPGAIKHWEDPVLGDPVFNETKIKPLIAKLDSYLPMVKTGMSDEEIRKVYNEAVPGWYNIIYTINGLRANYLQDKLSEE